MNISKPSGFQSQNGDSGSGGGFGGNKGESTVPLL
jgi:hypothetical protein